MSSKLIFGFGVIEKVDVGFNETAMVNAVYHNLDIRGINLTEEIKRNNGKN